jgi:hypothetical protein
VAAGIAVLLGLTTALGRGGLVGGGASLLLAAAWTAGARAAMKPEDLAAALGVVSVVVLGLLPRWALTTSGLTGLDDRRTAGTPVARSEVNAALAGAHRGLALATVAAAASAGVAGFVLAARPDRWTVPLALLLAGALLCRARAFPLVAEVVALVAAAVGIVGALLAAWWARASGAPGGPLVTVLALAAVPLLALAVEPAEHVRAALRRFGDLLEAACVVAAVPVAIGVSGVFGELLRTF